MNAMAPVPKDHPLMKAWTAFKATDEFDNSRRWARHTAAPSAESIVDGSLWALFLAGWKAATERAAALHESINPASDQERHDGSPGAGAMGAVIEYRDAIRNQS